MWQGLQTITDYKGKTSYITDTDVLLPDKLNNFFARFEDNTVPPTRPVNKDCGLSLSLDPLQLAYCPNRSIDEVIALHTALGIPM